ncbi:MAG: hypothetical protein J5930_05360 [Treponema sp.]|nr:hypothetical protein [Treponema sp.]
MGRKPLTDTTSEEAQAMDLVAQSVNAKENRKLEINSRFLETGETYNLHVCMEKARMYQDQMASGMLGLGAQLLLMKENEVHGNFMAAIEQLGLSVRSADYAMAAADKFGNSPTLANLGSSKLKALTVLDDDSVAHLAEGEEVEGLGTADDIAKMSVRELRAALRKEKQERQEERTALEEVVRKKESTISELEMEVAGRQPFTKERIADNLLAELRVPIMRELAAANESVRRCIQIVEQAQKIDGVNVDQLTNFSEQCNELFSLLDDNYQNFCQTMEYIRPEKQEE